MTYPVPADEVERLRSLEDFAAYICGVPNAVVNIISADQQHQIAAVGFQPGVCAREDSMCAISIVQRDQVVVPDARLDTRFADNPFVTGIIDDVRFYASTGRCRRRPGCGA